MGEILQHPSFRCFGHSGHIPIGIPGNITRIPRRGSFRPSGGVSGSSEYYLIVKRKDFTDVIIKFGCVVVKSPAIGCDNRMVWSNPKHDNSAATSLRVCSL